MRVTHPLLIGGAAVSTAQPAQAFTTPDSYTLTSATVAHATVPSAAGAR